MVSIRTLTQLQETLDGEMAWRIREISAFKLATKNGDSGQSAFVRAGVALLYAHWEGFIKSISIHYLSYVDNQGHRYRDLKSCFAVFGLKGKLAALVESKKSRSNIEVFEFVFEELDKPSRMVMATAIDTESNLSSAAFRNIAGWIGLDVTPYETKFHFLDQSLLERRNKIAHGEFLDVDVAAFEELVNETALLLRWFKTDIENALSTESFLLAVT